MKHLKLGEHRTSISKWVICLVSAVLVVCVILAASVFTPANIDSAHASERKSIDSCAVYQQNIVIQMSEKAASTAPSTTPAVEATSSLTDSEMRDEEDTELDDETYNYCDDTDLLARLIYLEAGSCSEHCQWLVGSSAMNLADSYDGLSSVAYDSNKFSVAGSIDSCDPSQESYDIAARVLSGDRDYAVKVFRTDYFHEWADPYIAMEEDNVYFSTY